MSESYHSLEALENRISTAERRISILEAALKERDFDIKQYPYVAPSQTVTEGESIHISAEEKGIESRIGRIGLAWLGMTVLLIGILFLTEYLMTIDQRALSSVIGYTSFGIVYFLARYFKKPNASLSSMFYFTGQIILFYVTLRLHFFSGQPLIPGKLLAMVLLLAVVAYQVMLTLREGLQSHGILVIIFIIITSLVSDSTHILLPMVCIASGLSFYLYYRFNWKALLIITMVLSYMAIFLWLFSNPFMGHIMKALENHQSGFIYFLVNGTCFSLLPLLRKEDRSKDDFIIGGVITNGLLFTFLLSLFIISFFIESYVAIFAFISAMCLFYSVVLKSTSSWNFASAFYALYGFMAMSIALYGLTGFPIVFLLLSAQSLIVVSMALWFRNKLMILLNSLLFLAILLIYLISSKSVDGVDYSFALIALVSARIINWKRERLNIKTDLIRNLYLISGFVMVLLALYHSVPRQFVTLSWTGAALLYFLLSFILKNVKYRYMAIGNMISAAVYLFIVDLARIELIYRVLALLSLAVVSIGISIYYANHDKKVTE